MGKIEHQFNDFLSQVISDNKEFVLKVHEALLQDDYRVKVEEKANGFFASYSHPKTKRSILNFLFRKKGLVVRVYADNLTEYADFLNSLPDTMEKEIEKAPACKRLINPETCNPKCIMGYDFFIRNSHYQKCRYNCFQFAVSAESIPILLDFVENERNGRQAG